MEKYKILSPNELTDEDITQIVRLDTTYYASLPMDEVTLGRRYKKVYEKNKEALVVLKDTENDKVIAFVSLMPINSICYRRIKTGRTKSFFIDVKEVVPYTKKGLYDVYISNIVVDKKQYSIQNLKRVLNGVCERLCYLFTEKGIIIKRLIADVRNASGERLCQHIGLKKVRDSLHDSSIYEAVLVKDKAYDKIINKISDGSEFGATLVTAYSKVFK